MQGRDVINTSMRGYQHRMRIVVHASTSCNKCLLLPVLIVSHYTFLFRINLPLSEGRSHAEQRPGLALLERTAGWLALTAPTRRARTSVRRSIQASTDTHRQACCVGVLCPLYTPRSCSGPRRASQPRVEKQPASQVEIARHRDSKHAEQGGYIYTLRVVHCVTLHAWLCPATQ